MKLGDYRTWLTEDLYKNLRRVAEMKKDYTLDYYIQVQFNAKYMGPAAACENEVVDQEFKQCDTPMNNRLVLMNTEPIPMFGTMLFQVRNGDLFHVYTMPFDKPNTVEDSDNYGKVVPLVAETAKHMPILF